MLYHPSLFIYFSQPEIPKLIRVETSAPIGNDRPTDRPTDQPTNGRLYQREVALPIKRKL